MLKDRIYEILSQLVAMRSTSYSEKEVEPAIWFYNFFKEIPYFKDHPEDFGLYEIPNDPFGRKIPFGCLVGKKKDAVLLSGHFDVVSTEEYGAAEEWAYDITTDTLEKMLADMKLNDEQRKDLESGEWMWGRGVADMKGGLSIHAALFEEYAKKAEKGELEGSILFMPVCDEESYSTGMRNGAQVIKMFREKYDLDFKLLIDPEPTQDIGGNLNMSIGSIGKIMPAFIVQGKKAHSGHCYDGISSLGIISEIYLATNGSLDFVDTYEDEAAMPPAWFNMRDMKVGYDVSIPQRSYGYVSVLNFYTTPEEYLEKVKKIAHDAMVHQVEKLNNEYQEYKKMNKHETKDKIYYEPLVLGFAELEEQLKKKDGEKFEKFFKETYDKALKEVEEGKSNFPSATIKVMEEVLNYSGITEPCVIIGFAPPYYPPVHADQIKGKEGTGTKVFEFLEKEGQALGQTITHEHYFTGISDLSYSAFTCPFNYESYSMNTPLWGTGYNLDFETIEGNAIPGIIYGPRGKEYHTFTERVNKWNLYEVVPETTRKLIEFVWNL